MQQQQQLPVSPEKLVALFESVVEQHVDASQGHFSIIYVLCLHLHPLLLLLGLLGTRHCLYYSSAAVGLDQCDGEQNMNLFLLRNKRIGLFPLVKWANLNRDAPQLKKKKKKRQRSFRRFQTSVHLRDKSRCTLIIAHNNRHPVICPYISHPSVSLPPL